MFGYIVEFHDTMVHLFKIFCIKFCSYVIKNDYYTIFCCCLKPQVLHGFGKVSLDKAKSRVIFSGSVESKLIFVIG